MVHAARQVAILRGVRLADQRAVLLKAPLQPAPEPAVLERLRAEHALAPATDDSPVPAPLALLAHGPGCVLVQADPGGTSLRARLDAGRLPLDDFFRLAPALVDAVEYLHRQRIIHGGIQPATTLLDEARGRVHWLDLGQASRLSLEHPDVAPPNHIEGALPMCRRSRPAA